MTPPPPPPPPPHPLSTDRLLASPATTHSATGARPGPTFPPPPSSVAARVAAFLPTLAAANDALAADVAAGHGDRYNVESVDEAGRHIEMDVAAGVLELNDGAAVAAAEAAVARGGGEEGGGGGQGKQRSSSSSSSSDEEDDDGSEGEEEGATRAPRRKGTRAPGITVVE